MVPIAMFIFPVFMAIIYSLHMFYRYMWYGLIVVNIILVNYALVYFRMVLRQNKMVKDEVAYRQLYLTDALKYPTNVKHCIVIPVYNESIQIIHQTLQVLGEHDHASEYTVVFALEERDVNHSMYAKSFPLFVGKQLLDGAVSAYSSKVFKSILTTVHPPESIKGKHVNLNYALPLLYKHFKSCTKVLITVTDADAHIPMLYMQHITRKYANHNEFVMFAPSTVFAQNPSTVPTLVRVKDASWAIGHMTSLISNSKIMPLSSYSLPLELIHLMNYWDVSEYGFGEDTAMMYRAVTYTERTSNKLDLIAVLIPFNYLNVNAGNYILNIKERYKQSLRHNLAFLMLEKSIYTAFQVRTKRMIKLIFNYAECVIMTLLLGLIWFVFGICLNDYLSGMENIDAGVFGRYWSEFGLKLGLVWMVSILPVIALVYDLNHYYLSKYKLYGLAKYDRHSILAHFDLIWFPMSCVFLIMAASIHSSFIIFKQQIGRIMGKEYDFMVDASKKQ
eukprot:NODE_164_length_16443_cov_0.166544.p2 type:complete len:503 gc:universal NODE_164_length_16443_cov_0.166544:16088-14580(-)